MAPEIMGQESRSNDQQEPDEEAPEEEETDSSSTDRVEWKEELLFHDGDAFFEDVASSIDCARRSIDLETYIFKSDSVGKLFEDALNRAARRGVRVRILVDGLGSSGWAEKLNIALKQSGAEIRVFHPLIFLTILSRIASRIRLAAFEHFYGTESARRRSVFFRINRRDHRKLCIVDHEIAWVGSMNITGEHSIRSTGHMAWRDTAVRVRGDGILDLASAFDYVWQRSHTPSGLRPLRRGAQEHPTQTKASSASPLVRLNSTARMRRRSFRDFISRVHSAQNRIWITNAYLAPSTPLLRALAKAAQRGVDVKILVPRKSDVFFMPWVTAAHYPKLLKSGIQVFEYIPSFLHAKVALIDDWAIVGSSNLNRRSLIHDHEVDVVVSKPSSIQNLEERFMKDLTQSEQIQKAPLSLAAKFGKFLSWLLKKWI